MISEDTCRDGGAESPVEGALDEDARHVQSCRYELRSRAGRKTNRRADDKCKSSLVRKKARKLEDRATEARAEADEIVKCLEREFLSLDETKGIECVRAIKACAMTRIIDPLE